MCVRVELPNRLWRMNFKEFFFKRPENNRYRRSVPRGFTFIFFFWGRSRIIYDTAVQSL